MSKRNTQFRRHGIVQLINEQGSVSVDELASQFETSEVTIRKDLSSLEKNGLLLRRYGGAIALPREVVAEENNTKISVRKLAIAKCASGLIRDHNRIIIDFGSTTGALVDQITTKKGLVVMTNSLTLANSLNELENEPTLLMTGGTWDAHSESFQGQIAESVLRSYDFDQLFIGVLCVFLLAMGMEAGKKLSDFKLAGKFLVGFGVLMPVFSGLFGVALGIYLLGFDVGGATLVGVLAASASYIAVPPAMRMAIPEANPSIYLNNFQYLL